MVKHLSFGLAIAAILAWAVAPANAAIIALYDFEAGGGGNTFDDSDAGLFSVDTEPNTLATRLASTTVDGGGANNIFNGAHSGSDSGPPVSNWGNGGLTEANANVVSFTVTPNPGFSVTYDSLSAFHGSYNGTGKFKMTYAIGAGADVEALPATAHTVGQPTPLTKVTEDFVDFTTSEPVTWKIHIFEANDNNTGHRIDDITINGTVSAATGPLTHNIAAARRARIRDNGRNTVEVNGNAFVGDSSNNADNRMLYFFDLSSITGGPLSTVQGDGTLSVQISSQQASPDIGDFFDLHVVDDNNVGWTVPGSDPTWNHLSKSGGTLWKDSTGADLTTTDTNVQTPGTLNGGLGAPGDGYAMLLDTVNQAGYAGGQTISWTIPAAVLQDMIDGVNAGFLIRTRDEGNFGRLQLAANSAQLSFVTDEAPSAIPEPLTMLAVGLSIGGLGGYVRKRTR